MLGMTLALRLARAGRRVTLLEARDKLGGLADAWSLGEVTWDRHYHVILPSDEWLLGLLEELGLGESVQYAFARTGCFAGGRLHPASTNLEFLRLPVVSLLDKLRIGVAMWRASRIESGAELHRVPVRDWMIGLSGRRAWERFWLPLVRSKVGEEYASVSASFLWATLRRLTRARQNGFDRERFGTVRGGYARIATCFRRALVEAGVELRESTAVTEVRGREHGLELRLKDGELLAPDEAVVTLAGPLAARLCVDLDRDQRNRLERTRYQGIACASLLLRRPLSPYYVTNLLDPDLPFTGVIEMSALIDRAPLNGRHLVYLPRYARSDDPIFAEPEAQLRERFLAGLRRMHPDLRPDDLLAFRLSRERFVHALATVDGPAGPPDIRTEVDGLYLAGSAQIVDGTLNVNETVRLAEHVAGLVVGDGDRDPARPHPALSTPAAGRA